MTQLNRQVVVWSHPMGTVAIPAGLTFQEIRSLSEDLPALDDPQESQSVRLFGFFKKGAQVDDVVDIGERNRVKCTIQGQRVTTVKWALSDEVSGSSRPSSAEDAQLWTRADWQPSAFAHSTEGRLEQPIGVL